MSVCEVFAAFLRGADNGTNSIHANRAAVLAHARRALVLAGPKGRLPQLISPSRVTDQAHMHRCLLRWICRAGDADRAKFVEVSSRVRGKEETAELLAEAREMFVEMKKRGEI